MVETKDNKIGIFLAVSKNWPAEQRKKYLEELTKQAALEQYCLKSK